MAFNMQNTNVLVDILTTLQRLENRFEDQNDRLTTIELSVRSDATSPVPPSVYRPSTAMDDRPGLHQDEDRNWVMNRFSVEQMAAEYKESVARLRNRFEFVDEKSVILQATGEVDEMSDWRSVSVYSSRPHSQLRFDAFPPPLIPPKDERRATCALVDTLGDDNNNNKKTEVFFSSTRYEDTLPTPPLTASSVSSNSSSSNSRQPPSTPSTSVASQSSQAPAAQISERNRHWIHGPAHKLETAKTAFKTSRLSRRSRKSLDRIRVNVFPAKARIVENSTALRRSANRAIKTCLRVVPNFFAWVGRKMVVQQMKRLDLAA